MTPCRASLLLVALSLLVLTAVPATAQEYPPDGPTAAVGEPTPALGEEVAVSGSGWQAGSEVTLTLLSQPQLLGTAQVDGNGDFSTTVTIPSDTRPGRHTLRVSGTGEDGVARTVDLDVQVRPAAPPEDPPPDEQPPALAATGANLGTGALVGLGLLVAGGGAVVTARRRQASSES